MLFFSSISWVFIDYYFLRLLRSEWIKAKYAREEFIYPDRQSAYCSGIKEGNLYKRGRDDKSFKKRRFVLTRKDNGHTLSYFVKEKDVSE